MDSFSWQLPTKVLFGPGMTGQMRRYFKGYGKRALIVVGKQSVKQNGLLQQIETDLNALGISFAVEEDIQPNPTIEQADEAASRQKKFKPQFIVAAGGGSVIDCAKAIAIALKNEAPLSAFLWRGEADLPDRPESALPIIAIPTMPASGSEINKNAVLTWKQKGIKSVIFHELLFPRVAVVDPQLTISLSREQSVYTAVDILSHALETYLSTNASTELQDEVTISICKTVKDNLEVVLKYPEYIEARKNIFFSGLMAQAGFYRGREGGWPLHWLEHPLSARYDIAHGLGLKLLLPEILKYDLPFNQQKIENLLLRLFDSKEPEVFQNWLGSLPGDFVLPAEDDLEQLADDVLYLNSRNDQLPNIKPLNKADIIMIYRSLQNATS